MNESVNGVLNGINFWRLQNIQEDVINVVKYVTFRRRLKFFGFQNCHIQTNRFDFWYIKLLKFFELAFSNHSIDRSVRHSSNSSLSLYQIGQACNYCAEPTDAFFIVLDGFTVQAVIDNDFTIR